MFGGGISVHVGEGLLFRVSIPEILHHTAFCLPVQWNLMGFLFFLNGAHSFEKSHLIISNANIAKYVFPLSLRFKLG